MLRCRSWGGEQLVEFFQKFDAPVVAESVIEVPKISLDMARRRLGVYLRPPQMAEQLVEVPTIVSYSSLLLRTAEQIIDIPVPQDRGVCGGEGGLQGFSPGLGATAYSGADLVDIPVPGRGGGGGEGGEGGSRGGLQGACPGLDSTVLCGADPAATAEQIVDIPVLHGASPDFHQDPPSSAGSSGLLDSANQGVFGTFPRGKKKCPFGSAHWVGTACGVEPIHAASLWRAGACGGGVGPRTLGGRIRPLLD